MINNINRHGGRRSSPVEELQSPWGSLYLQQRTLDDIKVPTTMIVNYSPNRKVYDIQILPTEEAANNDDRIQQIVDSVEVHARVTEMVKQTGVSYKGRGGRTPSMTFTDSEDWNCPQELNIVSRRTDVLDKVLSMYPKYTHVWLTTQKSDPSLPETVLILSRYKGEPDSFFKIKDERIEPVKIDGIEIGSEHLRSIVASFLSVAVPAETDYCGDGDMVLHYKIVKHGWDNAIAIYPVWVYFGK